MIDPTLCYKFTEKIYNFAAVVYEVHEHYALR